MRQEPEVDQEKSQAFLVIGQAVQTSVLSCTTWGLSCPLNCSWGGELLPRHFTLAVTKPKPRAGGIFSVTLSVDVSLKKTPPPLSRGTLPCGARTFLRSRISPQAGNGERRPSGICLKMRHSTGIGKAGSHPLSHPKRSEASGLFVSHGATERPIHQLRCATNRAFVKKTNAFSIYEWDAAAPQILIP